MASPLAPKRPRIDRSAYHSTRGENSPLPPPPLPYKGRGGEGDIPQRSSRNLVEEGKNLVKQMSATERKELRSYLLLLDQQETDSSERSVNLLADSLVTALATYTSGSSSEYVISKTLRKELLVAHGHVMALIDALHWTPAGVHETKALYNYLAGLLVNATRQLARKIDRPLTAKFVLENSRNLVEQFDLAFPGYLHSGLGIIAVQSVLRARMAPSTTD